MMPEPKLINALPAISPPARIWRGPSNRRPVRRLMIRRNRSAASAVQPAAGFAISRPVENRTPNCRFVPPRSCRNAPGTAHSASWRARARIASGRDRGHRHPAVRREEVGAEIRGVGEEHQAGRYEQSEDLGGPLRAPTFPFAGGVPSLAAEDPAGFQVVTHVGEGGSGGGSETREEHEGEGRKAEQHPEQEEDQRGREGREPPRVHRGDPHQQFGDEGGRRREGGEPEHAGGAHAGRQPAEHRHEPGGCRETRVAGGEDPESGPPPRRGRRGGSPRSRAPPPAAHRAPHLPERDRPGADHQPVGRMDGGEIDAEELRRVAAGEEAAPEHRQRGLVADPADPDDVGGNADRPPESSERASDGEQQRPLPALVAGAEALRRGDARRPESFRRKSPAAVEPVEHGDVEEPPEHRPDDHGRHEVRPAEEPHHPGRQQHRVRTTVGCRRDDGLQQVLPPGVAEPTGRGPRDASHRDGEHRSQDRAVRGDPHPREQLHSDHRPEQREPRSEQQGRRLEERRMTPVSRLRQGRARQRPRGRGARGPPVSRRRLRLRARALRCSRGN